MELRLTLGCIFCFVLHGSCISVFEYTHLSWHSKPLALGILFAAERLGECTSIVIKHANAEEEIENLQHGIPRSIVRGIFDGDYSILLYMGLRSSPRDTGDGNR